jgi:RNA polymerase sigma factor (sigma-70 family)
MISCAHIGLVEAARRYDPSAGDFPRFAYFRVRGAIIERYRRNAYRDMQHESLEPLQADERDSRQRTGIHVLRDPGPLPDQLVAERELRRLAAAAIVRLPDDERMVLAEVLSGKAAAEAAVTLGHSAAWGRAKLAAGREKVAAAVQGRRAA